MKYLKLLGLGAIAAMALTAYGANTASATTLEIGGAAQNNSVFISMSLQSGTSMIWERTDGSFINTCTGSNAAGATTTFTSTGSTNVEGPLSSLSFTSCTRPVTVHEAGFFEVEHTSGTDGTVWSVATEITVSSIFGTLDCRTGLTGTDIGTLTGADGSPSTHAVVHITAVVNCGFLVKTAVWRATYVVTSPTGLGVAA